MKIKKTGKWRCKICIVKRELAKKSGIWVPDSQKSSLSESNASLKNIMSQITNKTESSESLPKSFKENIYKNSKSENNNGKYHSLNSSKSILKYVLRFFTVP